MYSPRLYKYRDFYVLYKPKVNAFGSVLLTHTLLVQTHTHDVSAPCYKQLNTVQVIHLFILFNDDSKMQSSCLLC